MPETGISGVTIVNNATHLGGGPRAYPALQTGLRMAGNLDCTKIPCFANPDQKDFSPYAGSPLNRAGVLVDDAWMPREDFFGVLRSVPPTVGAIERPSGPLPLTPAP